MKLQDFLEAHSACEDGAQWAVDTGCWTIEEVWLREDLKFEWRIWIAVRVLDKNPLIKFACLCVREIWHILPDDRSRNAVAVAEQYAAGENFAFANAATRNARAAKAAWDASAAASAAAWAAGAAEWAASAAAAYAASGDARAARVAARAAAVKKQNAILRQLAPIITL
jgi:hypothetical protein